MAKKKLKMTDTKVRAVVVGAILLAFILALYFIFREPDNIKCPKGQIINSSGKCGDDPNFCSQAVGKSWKCTQQGQCVFQTNGNECRDCADPDDVYAEANPATLAFLKGEEKGFGVESPLLLSDVSKYTCQKRCNEATKCPDKGTCDFADFPDNLDIADLKPKVCKYKPIWFGVPTASNKNSFYCGDFKPGTDAPEGYNIPARGGSYKSLRECAMDTWRENESTKRPTGFKVGDYKNNNCQTRGKCMNQTGITPYPQYETETECNKHFLNWVSFGDPKLNADNTDCNTYPCTDSALGGWGSNRKKGAPPNESDFYLYKRPQEDYSVAGSGYRPTKDADESKVGTCFKTYKKTGNVEVATAPQVPDENDTECNNHKNEGACRNAAYAKDSYTVPHCKWYPAGSCLRIPKMLKPPTLDFDRQGAPMLNGDGIILDNNHLENIKEGNKGLQTDFPNFYGAKSEDWTNTTSYPKVLDYDPTTSNCKHKLMAQGATDDEAIHLCGQFNEEEEFNPLEFRRCAGVVSNQQPGYPTFHTAMQPFFVKTFNEQQKINAKKESNRRIYKEEKNISPLADSAPTSKDQAGNELDCVPLKKKSGALCDDSPECIQQAQRICDETPDCNGFFLLY